MERKTAEEVLVECEGRVQVSLENIFDSFHFSRRLAALPPLF